jgi:hypothetical protein
MFEAPLDAWYVWVGLAVVSGVAAGVVTGLPAAPPPDATGAAETVDAVAASEHATTDERPLPNAEAVRVGTDSLSLRGPGGSAHARFGYGPVTPAAGNGSLEAVLYGTPPERVFDSPAALERIAAAERARRPQWTETDRLVVRRVRWEGTDVVLVG